MPSDPVSKTDRLDDETERLINLMDYRDRAPGYSGPSPLGRALRSRIRTLVEEARKEGYRKAERMYFDD